MTDRNSHSSNCKFQLPWLVNLIIDWSVPNDLREVIEGDLSEGFYNKLDESTLSTYFWLYKQAILIFWYFSPTTQRGSIMFIFSFLVF